MLEYLKVISVSAIVVAAVVHLLKVVSEKWIEAQFKAKEAEQSQAFRAQEAAAASAHTERLKEIEHRYALLQQRESVKYQKIYETRWNELVDLPKQLGTLSHAIRMGALMADKESPDSYESERLLKWMVVVGDTAYPIFQAVLSSAHLYPNEFVQAAKGVYFSSMEVHEILFDTVHYGWKMEYREKLRVRKAKFDDAVASFSDMIRSHLGGDAS